MMKILLSSMVAIVIVLGCNREIELPPQIIGTGEIIENGSVSFSIESYKNIDTNYVINSQLENIFDLTVSFDEGKTYDAIDFDKFTMLGKYASGGGCDVVFKRHVERKTKEKIIVYSIEVLESGDCVKLVSSMNWVLISKIDVGETVEFVLK